MIKKSLSFVIGALVMIMLTSCAYLPDKNYEIFGKTYKPFYYFGPGKEREKIFGKHDPAIYTKKGVKAINARANKTANYINHNVRDIIDPDAASTYTQYQVQNKIVLVTYQPPEKKSSCVKMGKSGQYNAGAATILFFFSIGPNSPEAIEQGNRHFVKEALTLNANYVERTHYKDLGFFDFYSGSLNDSASYYKCKKLQKEDNTKSHKPWLYTIFELVV